MANIYLTAFDRKMETLGPRVELVRYCDDWVLCCPTEEEAIAALDRARVVLAELGLELHPGKTRIVDLDGGEGFDFLGFHHRMMPTRTSRGKHHALQKWPSSRSMNRARARVRALTSRPMSYLGIEEIVWRLNLFLRGWGTYFKYGNSTRTFAALDDYVAQRLARYDRRLRKKYRGWEHYGPGWTKRLGVHRLSGTTAHWRMHATR